MVRDHIVAFCFSLLQKDLDTFHELLNFFDNILWANLMTLLRIRKNFYKEVNVKKWFKTLCCNVAINFFM